jgi:hypothetical protein
MTEYIIKTDKEDKKTHILRAENPAVRLGMIYTDFTILPETREIFTEEIVDPRTNKAIANLEVYNKENILSVNSKREELSAITRDGEYREKGVIIPYSKLAKASLLLKKEYRPLKEMGVTHAYFLGEKSSLLQVFCFEKDGDLSGVVYSRDANDTSALKGLALVLAQRIEEQDFIFEFMRK